MGAHADIAGRGLRVVEGAERDLVAAGVTRYVALHDGVIVGGAGLRIAEGVAQLTCAATAPGHRRRGIHSALLSARLADAAAADCDVAVVTTQPESKSQENAQRRGFDLLYTRAVLVKQPDFALEDVATRASKPWRLTASASRAWRGAGLTKLAPKPRGRSPQAAAPDTKGFAPWTSGCADAMRPKASPMKCPGRGASNGHPAAPAFRRERACWRSTSARPSWTNLSSADTRRGREGRCCFDTGVSAAPGSRLTRTLPSFANACRGSRFAQAKAEATSS